MKKLYVCLYVVLYIILLSSFALADITLDQVKVYKNNERVSDVDLDGGDISANPSDKLEFVIYIKNTENTTSQAKIYSKIESIDDGSDIVKEQSYFDISADSSKSKILTFDLPIEIATDTYDMVLKVYFKYNNGTEIIKEVDYTIDVRQIKQNTDIDLKSSFNNLTLVCKDVVGQMSSCFGYVNQSLKCKDDLSTAENARGTFESNANTCASNLAACTTEKASIQSERDSCKSESSGKLTLQDCDVKVNKANNDSMLKMGMFVAGIGIVIFFMNKKKKEQTIPGATETYWQKR